MMDNYTSNSWINKVKVCEKLLDAVNVFSHEYAFANTLRIMKVQWYKYIT